MVTDISDFKNQLLGLENFHKENLNFWYDPLEFEPDDNGILKYIGKCAEICIPNGVIELNSTFYKNNNVVNVVLPDSISIIGYHSFGECAYLKNVSVQSGVTEFGKFAFAFCIHLESISIPEGVTLVDNCCFIGCTGLREVRLPSTIKSVGINAFGICDSLKTLYVPEGFNLHKGSIHYTNAEIKYY